MVSSRLSWGVVALVLAGCSKPIIRPPPEAYATFGELRASYRNWSRVVDLCLSDQQAVNQDLRSMNALLTGFLAKTVPGPGDTWSDEVLAQYDAALKTLSVAVELHERSAQHAQRSGCAFEGVNEAVSLATRAHARLEEGPAVLARAQQKKALSDWRAALGPAQTAAKARCPAPSNKPMKKPELPPLFIAFEDEQAHTEWWFCDGAKVTASPGDVPAFVASPIPTVKSRKALEPALYLEAAKAYPSDTVLRAPKATAAPR